MLCKSEQINILVLPSCEIRLTEFIKGHSEDEKQLKVAQLQLEILRMPIVKTFVVLSYAIHPLEVYCIVAIAALVILLTARMTWSYKFVQPVYAIATVALHIWKMVRIGSKAYVWTSIVVFGAIICPYPFMALGALRDLTGERARRWLPVYYEAETPDYKAAV